MSETFTLTPELRDAFERRGVVRLPGFCSRNAIAAMADRVWADLERRFAVRRDRPDTWRGASPGKFQRLRKSGAFDALRSPKMSDLANAMFGAQAWDYPAHKTGLLVTFPAPAPVVARPPWHLDIEGAEHLDPLPVLRVFTFLEPVLPNGGGTLCVAGTHRLAMEFERARGGPVRSAQVCDWLRAEHEWFALLLGTPNDQLRALIGAEAQAGGHMVRLEEMTGAPGDLIIMHPAILHGSAHNALAHPRMMLTDWIVRRGNSEE